MGAAQFGSFVEGLITSATIGELFILIPAILADRYPPAYVAWSGGVLILVGYGLIYMGWSSDDSPR